MAKNINKNYNTTSTTKLERNEIAEIMFNVDKQPVEIERENQAFLKNLYASIQRELEKVNYSRNWAVREVPLCVPTKDDKYQRESKPSDVTYLVNHFDMNKVDVKLCSLRKDENGIFHLLVIDGWHT